MVLSLKVHGCGSGWGGESDAADLPQGMTVRVSLLGGGTLFTPATVLRRYMAALPTSIIKLWTWEET